jgi:hypothetical protein
MSDIWLLAESFEQGNRLIQAVNVLSIHTKLLLAGLDDSARTAEAEQAKGKIRAFLQTLDTLVPQVEADNEAALPGQAPRAGAFVRRFVQARRQDSGRSPLFAGSISEFVNLLDAKDREQEQDLVEGLAKLREMLEQHHHADVSQVLGQL